MAGFFDATDLESLEDVEKGEGAVVVPTIFGGAGIAMGLPAGGFISPVMVADEDDGYYLVLHGSGVDLQSTYGILGCTYILTSWRCLSTRCIRYWSLSAQSLQLNWSNSK